MPTDERNRMGVGHWRSMIRVSMDKHITLETMKPRKSNIYIHTQTMAIDTIIYFKSFPERRSLLISFAKNVRTNMIADEKTRNISINRGKIEQLYCNPKVCDQKASAVSINITDTIRSAFI
jgi:hypothetical protein